MVGTGTFRGGKPRRLAVVIVVGALAIASCGDDTSSPATPGTTSEPTTSDATPSPETTGSTTTWSPPDDDPTQPSPAAVAADRDFRVAPSDLLDCGVHVRTTGYPTTFPGDPTQVECIVDAAATGTPAQFVSTARDFVGGMEGTIFRVLGPSEVLVIAYTVDPRGDVATSETTCEGLEGRNSPIPTCN